jgi:Fe-S-cluster containining protein
MSTFCLTVHAGYRCRHTGECCRNWTVAAEPHVRATVETRQIRRSGFAGALFVPAANQEDRFSVARDADGSCAFFDGDRGRLCVIHESAGPEALPTACRHFPRMILRDARGIFISLSHFCPTAAAMLLDADPLDVVEAGPPLLLQEPMEGMNALGALPPLVRPGVLSDLEGYAAWERACLAVFARPDVGSQEALDHVADATERVRGWRPGTCSLREQVHTAFREARHERGADPLAHDRALRTLRSLSSGDARDDLRNIDTFDEHWRRLVGPSPEQFERAMKNFLAARVFGNWIAYQGRGLRSIVEWLRACAAAVRHHTVRHALARQSAPAGRELVEAFRTSDLLLLHVIDTQAFARLAMVLEGPEPR